MTLALAGPDFGETLAASIARAYRADAIYFQARAKDNAALASYTLEAGVAFHACRFQRSAAFFAAEAWRSLSRLIEAEAVTLALWQSDNGFVICKALDAAQATRWRAEADDARAEAEGLDR